LPALPPGKSFFSFIAEPKASVSCNLGTFLFSSLPALPTGKSLFGSKSEDSFSSGDSTSFAVWGSSLTAVAEAVSPSGESSFGASFTKDFLSLSGDSAFLIVLGSSLTAEAKSSTFSFSSLIASSGESFFECTLLGIGVTLPGDSFPVWGSSLTTDAGRSFFESAVGSCIPLPSSSAFFDLSSWSVSATCSFWVSSISWVKGSFFSVGADSEAFFSWDSFTFSGFRLLIISSSSPQSWSTSAFSGEVCVICEAITVSSASLANAAAIWSSPDRRPRRSPGLWSRRGSTVFSTENSLNLTSELRLSPE